MKGIGKRIAPLLFTILMLLMALLLSSCIDSRKSDNTFEQFRKNINEQRLSLYNQQFSFEGWEECIKDDPADKTAITQEEADALKRHSPSKLYITHDEMAYDVRLFFNTLRNAWGSYYYWGGNAVFEPICEEIIAQFAGVETISTRDLSAALANALSFIKDKHFAIASFTFCGDEDNYVYLYNDDLRFAQDASGFFIMQDGVKWHFDGISNDNAAIKRTLFSDGTLGYGLAQITAAPDMHDFDTLALSGENGDMEMQFKWKRSGNYDKTADRNWFRFEQSADIAYLSARSLAGHERELYNFAYSGAALKNAKVIIIDLRGNGGGNTIYMPYFVYSYKGRRAYAKSASVCRYSLLNSDCLAETGSLWSEKAISQGRILKNKSNVLILVDNNVASSAEMGVLYLQSLENSIVIGSNTSGCELFGNLMRLSLPNSGISFALGADFRCYTNTMQNIEGRGFDPDIWADPATVIEALLQMLVKYDVAAKEKIEKLKLSFCEPAIR